MTQSKWVTTWVEDCYYGNQWALHHYHVETLLTDPPATTIVMGSQSVNMNIAPSESVNFELEAIPGYEQSLSLELGSMQPNVLNEKLTVQVLEEQSGNWMSLGSFTAAQKGTFMLTFTPTQALVKVKLSGNVGVAVVKICTKKPVQHQENILVDICPEDKDRYRFGFNGKEKINEWAGIGNYLDYGARGEDTRIGRLGYAIDPLTKQYPSLSPYQFAANSPIQNVDVDGLESGDGNIVLTTARQGVTVIGQQTAKEVGKMSVNAAGHLVETTPLWQKALPWVGKALGTVVYVFMPVENAKPNYQFRAQLKKESDKNDKIYETYQAYRQKTGQKIEPENEVGPERKVTLYRGVNAKHPALAQAYIGMAVPIGGDATPFDHNSGATESEYTSWSIDKSVAEYHGSKKGNGGVVLTKEFKVSEITPSPDQYSEGEVLVKGVVVGATVEPAKGPGSSMSQFPTK